MLFAFVASTPHIYKAPRSLVVPSLTEHLFPFSSTSSTFHSTQPFLSPRSTFNPIQKTRRSLTTRRSNLPNLRTQSYRMKKFRMKLELIRLLWKWGRQNCEQNILNSFVVLWINDFGNRLLAPNSGSLIVRCSRDPIHLVPSVTHIGLSVPNVLNPSQETRPDDIMGISWFLSPLTEDKRPCVGPFKSLSLLKMISISIRNCEGGKVFSKLSLEQQEGANTFWKAHSPYGRQVGDGNEG